MRMSIIVLDNGPQKPSEAHSEHSYHFPNDRDKAVIDHLLQFILSSRLTNL